MTIFADVRSAELSGPTYLTIGNFDGLHLGHQTLIRRMRMLAAQEQSEPAHIGLLTFTPHPMSVLRPDVPLHLLTTPEERAALALKAGATFSVLQPFTAETAKLRAVEFMTLLKQHLSLTALVVGPDFALGRGRSGNLDRLREIGRELDYALHVVDSVEEGGISVRSSRIRTLLQEGNVAEAAALLGRPYRAGGFVVEGDMRGRTIGFPTANVRVAAEKLLPANGVYATCTTLENGAQHDSVTNIGVRPTVDGRELRFETHLLDFPQRDASGDLYGQQISIEFLARLRAEQRFDGIDALVAQIKADVERARSLFLQQPQP